MSRNFGLPPKPASPVETSLWLVSAALALASACALGGVLFFRLGAIL